MSSKATFKEKQYLGRDYSRISIRLVMILFCFAAYYINIERDKNGELFLVVGSSILIVSLIMLFMVHYRTTVINKSVIIDGLWTTRLVKIDLNSIVNVERVKYSSYIINNPVYNLHTKGKIRFYAGGKDAVSLTDRGGLEYVIGTQCPEELEAAIKQEMNISR
ncbi:hypothetical protein [Pararcticibacter amylolyticus]|uniref:DUF304 domain-containing protein n=1 Tax=Pararcticibacter amylolyticus TaxID=2173175 RepID=A0A2U2PEA0_9SPHI|nr:hypothetical protein [Pararcticibacter amylolyticus]PWG79449.1 hypothetical protein DDR33_16960 [Pararcticibacter amylolyticus]